MNDSIEVKKTARSGLSTELKDRPWWCFEPLLAVSLVSLAFYPLGIFDAIEMKIYLHRVLGQALLQVERLDISLTWHK